MYPIETLESRRLMSVSLNAVSHLLTVNGTAGDDVIKVAVVGDKVRVTDNGVVSNFLKSKVTKIAVFAKDGTDQVAVESSVFLPTELHTGAGGYDEVKGGSGKDTIYVESTSSNGYGNGGDDKVVVTSFDGRGYGNAGNDTIVVAMGEGQGHGGDGNDTISVTWADNTYIDAGAGNDVVRLTNPANYSGDNGIIGGPGVDTVDYSGIGGDLVLRNDAWSGHYFSPGGVVTPVSDTDGITGVENLTGGAGNDIITGTAGKNILKGNGGNDTIRGMAGGDVLWGAAGNDKLYGGDGADALQGEAGDDFLQGDAGNDFLSGGTGADALHGNDGDDVFYSKDGAADFLAGGLGYDQATKDAMDIITGIEAIS